MKTFGNAGKFSYAFEIEGVNPRFIYEPFGRQLDDLKKVKEFQSIAKKGWIRCKHRRSNMAAVREWVKEVKPKQFWVKFPRQSANWKDDSVEIYFTE